MRELGLAWVAGAIACSGEASAPADHVVALEHPASHDDTDNVEQPRAGAVALHPAPQLGFEVVLLPPVPAELLPRLVDAAFATRWPDVGCARRRTTAGVAEDGWKQIVELDYSQPSEGCGYARATAFGTDAAWRILIVVAPAAERARAVFIAALAESQLASLHAKLDHLELPAYRDLDDAARSRLAEYFEMALASSGIPGGAFAIVENGEIAFSHAAGRTRFDAAAPRVETSTIFRIASLTKPLVVAAIGTLVAENLILLDAAVLDMLHEPSRFGIGRVVPGFTIRSALCACFGLARKDAPLVFRWTAGPPRDLDALSMSHRGPAGVFGYNNQAFALGAYAAAYALGRVDVVAALPAVVREAILEPLDMSRTSIGEPMGELGDRAGGHALGRDGTYVAISDNLHAGLQAAAPAAGGWSTVDDLALFLSAQARPCAAIKRSACESGREEQRRVHALITPARGYGLGWFVDRSLGIDLLLHGGDAVGFSGEIGLLPETAAGYVVLLNGGDGQPLLEGFRARLLEEWFRSTLASDAALERRLAEQREGIARRVADVEAVPVALAGSFVGVYANDELGELVLARTASGSTVSSEAWSSEVGYLSGADDSRATLVLLDPPLVGQRLELFDTGLKYASYIFSKSPPRGGQER